MRTSRAWASSPAGVSSMPRPLRSNSAVPSDCSSKAIERLTAEAALSKVSEEERMPPWRTTVPSVRSLCRESMDTI
jgi:hypothetical protein